MTTPPIITEGGSTGIGLEQPPGNILLEGGHAVITNAMPDLTGEILWDAIGILQDLGILVPNRIGYFGTYPISVIWVQSSINRGVVIGQSVIPGVQASINMPIVLTVNDYPISVAFP